jgi:adenylate cyclase
MDGRTTRSFYLRALTVSLGAVLMFGLLYAFLGARLLREQARFLYNQELKTGRMAVDHFVNQAAGPLVEDDTLALNVLLKETRTMPGIVYAQITDEKGIVKAHSDPTRIGTMGQEILTPLEVTRDGDTTFVTSRTGKDEKVLNISRPVTFMKRTIAHVQAGLSLDAINTEIARRRTETMRGIVGGGAGLMAVVICAASAFMLLLRPVSAGTNRVVGPTDTQPAASAMVLSAEPREPAANGPSRPVVHGGDTTQRNQVSVVLLAIKRFKTYAETRDPEALLTDFNEYVALASDVITRYGGYVDKFVGDAIVSVFTNSPMSSDHAERAVNAALAMQEAFQKNGANGRPLFLKVGIGISSGVVLSGLVGSGEDRELTFFGESFRNAYSLTVMAAAGEIIISREAYELLGDKVSVEPLPPREMLQRTEAWENFRLLRKA